MRPITKIFVACYRGDFYLTRICVASIRYFYPEVPIYLLKDYAAGHFDTRELEAAWQVAEWPLPRRTFGWGLSKLEPLFMPPGDRVLILDSDTVFVGKVLERLAACTADVVVSGNLIRDPYSPWVRNLYYHFDKLQSFDPDFQLPKYLFNTGNFVVDTGCMPRSAFNDVVEWPPEGRPRLLRPDVFSCADQGILNYKLVRANQLNQLSIQNESFMYWGSPAIIAHIGLADMGRDAHAFSALIHWAGTRHYLPRKMCRPDILAFFESYYYERVPGGKRKRYLRYLNRERVYAANQAVMAVKRKVCSLVRGGQK